MTARQEIAASWTAPLRSGGLTRLERLLESTWAGADGRGTWQPLTKAGLAGRERWRWEFRDGSQTRVLFVKRYRRSTLREQLDRLLRQARWLGRAGWEFQRCAELAAASIPAPKPVAYVERMSAVAERCGAVILESVEGEPLDRAWQRFEQSRDPRARGLARRDVAVRLGRFIAAFHSTGLCHRDLYLCHVFVRFDPDAGGGPRFSLIDLARTIRPRLRRTRWVIKDLSQMDASARQLGASRTDRYRCLLAYLGLERRAPRARWYARRVARKSDWIIRRAARRGRPIVPPPAPDDAGASSPVAAGGNGREP